MKSILVTLLICSTISLSGQTPYLERKITLLLDNETVEASLKKISVAGGGFVFSYSPDVIDQRKPLTHHFVNRSVREILDEIFKGTMQYKVRGQYIILTAAPKTSSRKDPAIVTGYVVDESTGERLKDVSVYDPVTLMSAVTDSYGYFEIKIDRPPSDIILSVNRENYVDTLLTVSNDRRLLNIPIRVHKEKLAVLANSVNQKFKRFWLRRNTWFDNINLRNIDDSLSRTFQISLVPFVGSNHKMSAHVTNDYSLNVLGGYSLGVRKVEFGGVFNFVRGDVIGAQAAGLFNGVGGRMTGLQVAGIFNSNEGQLQGAQFAGVVNINLNDAEGFSAAGVGNIATGRLSPAQVGGVFNIASHESTLQTSGVLNIARNVRGAQAAGVINVASENLEGAQFAGLFNISRKELRGIQLAGVINVARKVKGVQLGLFNFADSVKGIPFGLISVVSKGYHKIEISADEIFYNNVAFRTGVRHFYNILQVGAKPLSYREERTIWTFGYGLGTSAKLTRRLFLDFDVTSNQIVEGNSIEALNLLNKVYLGFDIQMFKKLSLSMGATLNGLITETDYDAYPALFTDYQPNIFADRHLGHGHNLKMWAGAKVGLRFL